MEGLFCQGIVSSRGFTGYASALKNAPHSMPGMWRDRNNADLASQRNAGQSQSSATSRSCLWL